MSNVTASAYCPEMFKKWSEKELSDLDEALNEALKPEQQVEPKKVSMGVIMTGGVRVTQRDREKNDHYPTPPEATAALMKAWCPEGDVWEPCAAQGKLSDVVQKYKPSSRIFLSDIDPRRDDVEKLDFLSATKAPADDLTIITNPPFKYAEKFIRKGFELGIKRQAFLLKATYFHASTRTDFFYQHRPSHVFALNWRLDFMNLGRPVMECAWFVYDSPCAATTVYDVLSKPI